MSPLVARAPGGMNAAPTGHAACVCTTAPVPRDLQRCYNGVGNCGGYSSVIDTDVIDLEIDMKTRRNKAWTLLASLVTLAAVAFTSAALVLADQPAHKPHNRVA